MSIFGNPRRTGAAAIASVGRRRILTAYSARGLNNALGWLGRWSEDEILRRLARNVAHLLSGRIVSALIGIVTLGIFARALGAGPLGVLVMITAYARLLDQVVRLETWHALIKYGGDSIEQGRPSHLRQLVKFGMLVDICGALISGSIVLLTVPLAGKWLDWSAETIHMARIYSLVIVLHIASTPTAVLRLYNRFVWLAWLESVSASLLLLLTAAAWLGGAGIWAFLLAMMAVEGLHNCMLAGLAYRELRRQGHGSFLRERVKGVTRNNRSIWNMMLSANLSVLIRKSTQELDVLIVGAMLGPAAVGLYHLAKRLGGAALKFGALLQQAVYPDLARLWARREIARFRGMVLRVSFLTLILASVVLLVFALKAADVVRLIAGPGFEGSVRPLLVQMVAVTLALCGITLRPALLSMAEQALLLRIVTLSAIAFYVCLVITLPIFGVLGASLAHVAFQLVLLPSTMLVFLRITRAAAAVNQRSNALAVLPEP